MRRIIMITVMLLAAMPALATVSFTPDMILQWGTKSFVGDTAYQSDGEHLFAQSNGTASGLFYEKEIDLTHNPVLHWRWKPSEFPTVSDEREKNGDDFVLRVYVVARTGWGPWSAKAITYVWSQTNSKGDVWDNPFTGDSVKMVALRDQSDLEQWMQESRNIRQDFQRYFGIDVTTISALAIMTDADNSSSVAAGFYDSLQFKAQ